MNIIASRRRGAGSPARGSTSAATGLAVLALAACGGDQMLTKEDFISKADEICATAGERVQALGKVDPFDPGSWADFLEIGAAALVDLRALAPVQSEAEAIDQVLTPFERIYAMGHDQVAALRAGDRDEANRLIAAAAREHNKAVTAAAAYGFDDCLGFATY